MVCLCVCLWMCVCSVLTCRCVCCVCACSCVGWAFRYVDVCAVCLHIGVCHVGYVYTHRYVGFVCYVRVGVCTVCVVCVGVC